MRPRMIMYYKFTIKVISASVLAVALSSASVLAQERAAKSQKNSAAQSTLAVPSQTPKPFDINQWRIPDTCGSIKETHRGNKDKTIIYMQDAHCNFEAQQNNAKILQDLIGNYGIKLVAVEGSSGIIDTTPFAQFPDKDIKTEVATYFMKKGRITGPEFLSITSGLQFTIYGIEDEKMYKINYDAFIKSLDFKESVKKVISELKGYTEILKANIYTPDLKEMDKIMTDYKANKISFTNFSDYLAKSSDKLKMNLSAYPHFAKHLQAKKTEGKIDFKAVDNERNALMSKLEKSINRKQVSDLVVKSLSFRMGKISAEDFYTFLRNLAKEARVNVSGFKNLEAYTDHLKLYGTIDSTQLSLECDKLTEAVQNKLVTNPEQQQLTRIAKDVGFLEDLFDLKLSSRDLDYYRSRKGELGGARFASFFKQYANRYGIGNIPPERFSTLDQNFSVVEDFYETAKKRDHVLLENAINKMEDDAQKMAVMVTGGFHSEGITDELKRRGFSYVVVTPRITDLNAENYYIDVMTNKKTPFEELLGAGEAENQ